MNHELLGIQVYSDEESHRFPMEDNNEIVKLYLYLYFYREKETPPALVQLSLKYESMKFSFYSHIISCTCSGDPG